MTFVVARRFGERIIVYSDTMISDKSASRQNLIPGVLKSIVIHRYVSIAFAGSVPTAIGAIRSARDALATGYRLSSVVEQIRLCSEQKAKTEQACDFIITSHLDVRPAIYRIWDGQCIMPTEECWIGNDAPRQDIEDREKAALRVIKSDSLHMSREEHALSQAIFKIAIEPAALARYGIGGMIFNQLGSPFGHTYQGESAVAASDSINLAIGVTAEQMADRASGMTEYRYSTVSSAYRGAGVVGAFLEQARIGVVYSPLTSDTPMLLRGTDQRTVLNTVSSLAEAQGGSREERRADGTT